MKTPSHEYPATLLLPPFSSYSTFQLQNVLKCFFYTIFFSLLKFTFSHFCVFNSYTYIFFVLSRRERTFFFFFLTNSNLSSNEQRAKKIHIYPNLIHFNLSNYTAIYFPFFYIIPCCCQCCCSGCRFLYCKYGATYIMYLYKIYIYKYFKKYFVGIRKVRKCINRWHLIYTKKISWNCKSLH